MTDVSTLPGGRAGGGALTAVVCTRDRPGPLQRALDSLAAQTVPTPVLVVDNAPSDDAAAHVCAAMEARRPGRTRYVREPVEGLDFARNRALRECDTPFVAFLDDDAVAEPDWAERTIEAVTGDPDLTVCLGRVEALSLETEGERLFEANGGFSRGTRPVHLPEDAGPRRPWRAPLVSWIVRVGSGCSMAVRRERAIALGGFDDALDLGRALAGGGDLDFIWRALAAGDGVRYEPSIRARHAHRQHLSETVEQILAHNRSLIVTLDKTVRRSRGRARAGPLLFLAWRLMKPWVRLARGAVGRDPLPHRALLRLPFACWGGLGEYPRLRQLAASRRRAGDATGALAP